MHTLEHTAGRPLRGRGNAAEGEFRAPERTVLGRGRISRGLSRLSWSAVMADVPVKVSL